MSKLHESTTKNDIMDFLNSAIKRPFFFKQPIIDSIVIMAYYHQDNNHISYYSLVNIEPDDAAKKAIDKLNRKPLKGKRVNVREYVDRNYRNDRRDPNGQRQSYSNDRRKVDRRQQALVPISDGDSSVKLVGDRKFHQKHH